MFHLIHFTMSYLLNKAINMRSELQSENKLPNVTINKIASLICKEGLLTLRKERLERLTLVTNAIKDIQTYGKFNILVHERNCYNELDVYTVEFSNLQELDRWIDDITQWAEGPTTWKHVAIKQEG